MHLFNVPNYIYKLADAHRIWKQRSKFYIRQFSPIENHYKEKFNVSGLLNENNSNMKNNY